MQMWEIGLILDMKHKKKFNFFFLFPFEGYLKGSFHCHSNVWAWGLMFKLDIGPAFSMYSCQEGMVSASNRSIQTNSMAQAVRLKCVCGYIYTYPFGTEIQIYQHD